MAKVFYSRELQKLLPVLKNELKEKFRGCKKLAIKIHFGEPGNNYALKPEQVKPIIDILNETGFGFFMFDSPVAYNSPRRSVEGYKKAAIQKGWNSLGEIRTNDDFVEIKGKSLTYQVCRELGNADGVLVISHVKGHVCCGFGGAIKNLGMGAQTKKTKSSIHSGGEPVLIGKCTQCKTCERECPINGIKVTDKPNFRLCLGCSNCAYVCPANALKPKVNYFDVLLAEAANAAQSTFKKFYYVSIINNITRKCDCESNPGELIAKDYGFICSEDGVAIDRAAHDIIAKDDGEVFLIYNKKTGLQQIEAAEKLGMGRQKYDMKIL